MPVPSPSASLGSYLELGTNQALAPVPILADMIDPATGDITALLTGRTPVDGAIVEGFRVERGTGPAVQEVGHTLRRVRHTDPSSLGELRERARDGIRSFERAGLVRLESWEDEVDPDAQDSVAGVARVRDLTRAADDPDSIRGYRTTTRG